MPQIKPAKTVFFSVIKQNKKHYNVALRFSTFPRLTDEMWELISSCVYAQNQGHYYILLRCNWRSLKRVFRQNGLVYDNEWLNQDYRGQPTQGEKKYQAALQKKVDNFHKITVY